MSQDLFARPSIIACVTEIVSSHLSNNSVPVTEIPNLIRSIHATLSELDPGLVAGGLLAKPNGIDGLPGYFRFSDVQTGEEQAAAPLRQMLLRPAVPIEESVHQEYIVCLEDGKRLRMLKRYLRTRFGMSPDDYRAKWKLPADYPMAAPAVIEQRRLHAQTLGLGRKPRAADPAKVGRKRRTPAQG